MYIDNLSMFRAIENFYSNYSKPNNCKPLITGRYSNATAYKPSINHKIDVVFTPVSFNGDLDYVAAVEDSYFNSDILEAEYSEPLITPVIAVVGKKQTSETPNIFSVGDDNINNLFIGSITVVGLFVLFSLLQKHGK